MNILIVGCINRAYCSCTNTIDTKWTTPPPLSRRSMCGQESSSLSAAATEAGAGWPGKRTGSGSGISF